MGMFDSITNYDQDPRLSCAHSHPIIELQTKDLDNVMDNYHLYRNQFYKQGPSLPPFIVASDHVILKRDSVLSFQNITETVRAYGECPICTPVLVRGANWNGDGVTPHRIWNEFKIVIVNGNVHSIEAIERPTREELTAQLIKQGHFILDENSELFKRYSADY